MNLFYKIPNYEKLFLNISSGFKILLDINIVGKVQIL